MKKHLLYLFLVLGFTQISGNLFAAVPTINYAPANPYTVGTPMSLTPTVGNGVSAFAYGAATILGTGAPLNAPWGLGTDNSGNIYVANSAGNNILEYSASGAYIGIFIAGTAPTLTTPVGIVFDAAGNAYVLRQAGVVYKYSSTGAYIGLISSGTGTGYGIAIDKAGNLYWSDWSNGAINKYSTATSTFTAAFINLGGAYGLSGVATDASGNVYFTDIYNTYKAYEYSASGTPIATSTTAYSTRPYGISVDASGNVYVSDSGAGKVYVYNPAFTTLIATVTVTGSSRSTIADGKGNLYVNDFTNKTLTRYSPIGGYFLTGTLPSGLIFNSTTGVISGTPTSTVSSGPYTVTAYNASGAGTSNTFNLTFQAGVPTVAYTGSPYSYTVGTGIPTLTPATTNSPTSFTISPNLTTNTGLTFDPSTGIISGNPTTVSGPVTYTITAINANPTHGTTTISIQVYPKAPTVAYTGSPFTYGVSTAIATLTPTTTNSPTSFTISPSLFTNTGLNFDTSTGIISGTPTTASAAVTYTITAINANPTHGTTTISIKVLAAPTVTYTGSPYTYTVGTTIPTLTPATSNSPTSFTISPDLNANTGLSFNTSTGLISGNPTTATIAITYTITAYNIAGAGPPTTIIVTVNPKAPTVAYTGSPFTFGVGTPISTLTPATTNSPTSFTISPNLNTNTGLTFDTSTGIISGTPTTASGAVTYTITAINANPTHGSTTISITVLNPPTVTYTGSPYFYTVGTAITTLTPATTNSPTSFTISPSLNTNTGLTFNTTTGVISGTPTTASVATTYTITGYNIAGAGAPTTINVTVYPKAPTVAYTGSPYTFGVGVAISTLTPATTNSPTSFTISPNLTANTGLTFNTTTGVISGTPTTASGAVTYTITAINANPTNGTTTITVTVVNPPTVAYTGSPYFFIVGTPITTLTPATTNSPTSFSISPNLNANTGLTFDTTTGNISGTPTTLATVTTYTITAYNVAGSGSTTIDITVSATPPPTVAYAGSPYTYTVGTAITSLTPSTTYFPTSYSISPNLTANTGLTFNTTTGVISGTPTTASLNVTYTITAFNSGGSGTTTIDVLVYPAVPTVAYTGSPFTFGVSVAITSLTPATTNSPTSFTISPNLTTNTGLSFDPATGIISGTPTTASAAVTYTITAYNANPTPGSTTIVISVINPPTVAYTGSPFSYTVGTAITSLTPATTNSPTSFSISPNLTTNTGLTFNTTTGVISGNPTTASAPVTYTITAYNVAGSGTTMISIQVYPKAPTVAYTGSPYTYGVTTPIASLTPTTTNSPTTFTISPNLTANTGLTFNTATGVISGTPTTASAAVTYTISAFNANPIPGTTTISITVVPKATITYPTPNSYTVGTPIPTLSPTIGGGSVTATPSYGPGTVILTTAAGNGSLNSPVGMSTDPSGNLYVTNFGANTVTEYSTSGVISTFGTPYLSGPVGIVFDSMSNAYVLDKTSNNVVKFGPAPSFTYGGVIIVAANGLSTPTGIAIDVSGNLYVANSGSDAITKYASTGGGALLTINATGLNNVSGGISVDAAGNIYVTDAPLFGGTAVDEYSPTGTLLNQTSTAANGTGANNAGIYVDGSGNFFLTNTAGAAKKGSVYTSNAFGTPAVTETGFTSPRGIVTDSKGNLYISDFTLGTVTKYAPLSGYYLSGALPPGLSFNSTNGNITGVPSASFSGSYTVTAYNVAGPGTSNTFSITVILTAPMIAYIPNSYTFAVNTAITPIDVTNTGGPVSTTPGYGPGIVILTAANGLNGPWGVTTDPSGNIYTVNYNSNSVTEYNSTTLAKTTFIAATPTANPIGIVFDSFGNAYVLTTTNLYKYSSTGALLPVTYTGIANGTGIAIDAGNNIFVSEGTPSTTNTSNDHVIKYTTTGGAGNLLFTPSLPYGITGGIAVDAEDNVYPVDNLPSPSVDKYNQAGVLQGVFSFIGKSYGVAVDGANNVFIAGNGQILIENSDATKIAGIPNLTDPRAVVVDQQGNVYVSDYTNNTVTEYKPNSGYILTGTLPPGLTFDNTTGEFAGTPTTIFPAITLTVTGYNASGSSSTPITFTCGNANYWHGITAGNTDWNTASNWSAGTVPLATDVAYIGTTYGNTSRFQYLPTISNGETPTIAAVVMGSANKYFIAPGIKTTGNGTLTVTTNITFQGDNYSANNYTATFSGTGTIKANSVIISTAYNDFESYTLGISSSINSLQLSGSLSLIAGVDNTNDYSLPVFNVTGGTTSVAGTIQTSNVNNNAASISTLTVKPVSPAVATLQLANSAALSGLSPYGVNTISFKNPGATIEYSGLNNQTVYTDAIIAGLASGGPSYQNIKFSGTGVKTPNGTATSNLNVAGDFTNTLANDPADYVNLTNTVVNFNGTTQALAGGAGPTYSATSTIVAPNPAGTVFNKVNFSGIGTKTIASGGIVVASTGVLTMSGSGAVLAAGGFLTLNSDANSSATVPVIPTGSSITGNVNVQRWVSGGAGHRGYRLMSSPVNGTLDGNPTLYSLNFLNNSTWIKSYSGIGFSGGVGTDNIFLYRENLAPSNATFTSGNYNGINSMGSTPTTYAYPVDGNALSPTFNIPVGNGFLFFFRGDKLVAPLATEAVSTYTPTSAITIATGTLNQGTIAFKDWYTSASPYLGRTSAVANAAVRGYNLVGNPYASTIDLTKASTTAGAGIQLSQITNAPTVYGVETNFYELNPTTQNFDVWSNSLGTGTNYATQYIASGQGFFVVADTTNQTITFNESAKVNAQNSGPQLYMATGGGLTAQNIRAQRTNTAMLNNNGRIDQHIRLKLAMDTVNKDDIYIGFDPSAQGKFVANEDATYKQGSGKVSFSSFSSDNVPLAINSMPLPAVSQTVGLKVYATADGVYSLNMSELKNIPDMYDVWLMDAYKRDSLNMRKSATYSFNLAHADTNSFGSKRFSLVIRQNPALATRLLTFTAAKATNGAQMTWKTMNEQNYTNFTVQRSTDGGNTFSNLGALVSNSAGSYSFVDNNPVVPADSYRLQITDLNGNISYSNIVPLQYSNLSNNIAATTLTIYPNPTVSTVNIAINQTFNTSSFDIQIVNSSGVVMKKATSTTPSWQSDVSRLLPGTYVIQVVKHSDQTVVGRGTFVKL